MVRSIRTAFSLVMVAGLVSCFQYRAQPLQAARGPEPQSKMVWSFLWGIAGTQPAIDCGKSTSLSEVTVKDNFAFTLLTVISVGLVSPKRVEWNCAVVPACPGHLGADSTTTPADSA